MQRNPQEIKAALLQALDTDYNVINMPVVVEIIGILEQTPITKEALESTRLGKYINELRRKTTNESVAKRAKDLVRKWRDLIVPESAGGGNGVRALHKGQLSPGLPAKRSQPASPASRVSSLSPETKLAPSPAISPRLQGYSPQPGTPVDNGIPTSRGRGRPPGSSKAPAPSSQTPQATPPTRQRGRPPKNKNKHKRPASDLVPKTSPANKRLRKKSPDPSGLPVRVNGVCEVPVDSMARTPKVKTTRQLLQSIQQESSLDLLRSKTLSSLGVARPPEKTSPSKSSTKPSPSPSPRPSSSSSSRPNDLSKLVPRQPVKRPAPVPVKSPPPPRPVTPPSPTGSEIVDVEIVEDSPIKPPEPETVKRLETVEEILARLPPVDPDEIQWSDELDSDVEPEPVEVTPEDVRRLLECHVEGLNGNQTDGRTVEDAEAHGLLIPLESTYGTTQKTCPPDCSFREWHQTLSKTSYQGELLHILPYVIID